MYIIDEYYSQWFAFSMVKWMQASNTNMKLKLSNACSLCHPSGMEKFQ